MQKLPAHNPIFAAGRVLAAIALLMPAISHGWDPGVEWLQLQQQQQSSREALNRLQRAAPAASQQGSAAGYPGPRMDRQQRMSQSLLQERQRRNLLILNHRMRTGPAGLGQRSRFNGIQQRNDLESRRQLNSFGLQRLYRPPR